MTSSPFQTYVAQVTQLAPSDFEAIERFLGRDVVRNLFMLSWLDNYGVRAPGNPALFRFLGVHDESDLTAVALVITGRLAFLESTSPAAAELLGRFVRQDGALLAHIVSARTSVVPFWVAYRSWGEDNVRARLCRDQDLYVVDRADWMSKTDHREKFQTTGLRMAKRVDLEAVFWASAKMHAEETLEDPLERDGEHFRRHVVHRLDSDRTYVWFNEHRRLMFKADISAQSRYGVQVSGVFTPTSLRGQGIATRAMVDLCDILFSRGFPRVSLYVNTENPAAVRVYQKVGFRKHCQYQTVFIESDEHRE